MSEQLRPGPKHVWRRFAAEGTMESDLVAPAREWRDGTQLLIPVMRAGRRVGTPPLLAQIRKHAKTNLVQLLRRLAALESMAYPVEIDPALKRLADDSNWRVAAMQNVP